MSDRFARYRAREDRTKSKFLAACAAGAADDVALQRAGILEGTLRAWLREDPEFAAALHTIRTKPSRGARVISPLDYLSSQKLPPPPGWSR